MTHLTAEEKETVILFSEAGDTASIHTFDKHMKQKLHQLAGKFPDKIVFYGADRFGGVTYSVPKSCICIYPPHTEEWKDSARERAKVTGFQPKKTDR